MRFPDRSAVKVPQRLRPCRHVGEATQPDKTIGIIQVAKLADNRHAKSLLSLDEFPVEEIDQDVAHPWVEGVLAKLDDWATAWRTHFARTKSIVQFVSQVFPPSGEKACSQWAVSA